MGIRETGDGVLDATDVCDVVDEGFGCFDAELLE